MDLNTWLLYFLAAVGLSLSPGPNGLLALTHGALHGRRLDVHPDVVGDRTQTRRQRGGWLRRLRQREQQRDEHQHGVAF